MLKKIIAIVLSGCIVLSFAACSNVSKDDNTTDITICLDYTPNTNHTGIFVAKEKGYFKQAGLNVEIVQPSEGSAAEICASGKAQFAIDFQDYLASSYIQNLGITAVAAIINHNTAGIIGRSGELETPKGLEGDTYATYMAPIELAMTKSLCKNAGGDEATINFVNDYPSNAAQALNNKQFDSLCIYYAWDGINAQMTGDYDFLLYRELNPVFDYYSPVIIANNDFLNSSPDIAKKFLEAVKKGYEYAIDNPEESAEILIASDETGALNGREEFVKESQKWISTQYIGDGEKWGYIDGERWDNFYAWCFENGAIDTKIPEKTGYTNDYLL